ncbi:hypothetical protein HYT91_03705 [Candidatus Pacearchaeota archaeon]|nr:hypothetical protein [Candidatus Pacearchaeota archaeon]
MFEKLKKIIRNFKPSFESAEQKRDLALGRKRNLDAKRKFQKMNKKQKEDFLSNDFTERLIRSSPGHFIIFNN